MNIRFNTFSNKSQGLKALKAELVARGHNVKELKVRGSNYIRRPGDVIICWGCPPTHYPGELNTNAHHASNKLIAFQKMVRNGLRWTTDIEEAKTYRLCYCRTLLSASQGRGIVVAQSPNEVVPAPLYTKGIRDIAGEYRVHVFKGRVIDFAKKMRMNSARIEAEGITHNPLIRNLENGYIFGREGLELNAELERVAIESLEDLDMDFGAVDLVLSGYSGKAFTLEVNSAPGLQGLTIIKYADAIEASLT